jgi:hypothetical protein
MPRAVQYCDAPRTIATPTAVRRDVIAPRASISFVTRASRKKKEAPAGAAFGVFWFFCFLFFWGFCFLFFNFLFFLRARSARLRHY